MKKLFIFLLSGLAIASCKKNAVTEISPLSTETTPVTASKTTAVPAITSVISTVNGLSNVSSYTYGNYTGYLGADYDNSTIWTINGSNFGATQGTSYVQLSPLAPISWTATGKYTLSIVSWSNTQIKIRIKAMLTADPLTTSAIQVVTSGGTGTSSSIKVVPLVNGRQYIQCTWWAVKRTQETLSTFWTPAYTSAGTTSITPYYTPTNRDILIWSSHQAFIENVAVSTEASGTITVYSISISESNWASATFPHNATFVIKIKNTAGVKSFVAGFNSYRPISGAGATLARIQ